jgi:CRISPR-associated protein Csb1
MLLVESAQSMANRLERTCLDGNGPDIWSELEGIPYVVSELTGAIETKTSSLIEAHRLNSPWIVSDKNFAASFVKRANYEDKKPLDWRSIAEAVFYYDPNSLIHGLFMVGISGRLRLPRALSGFIEAFDVVEAYSGGVKNNPLDPTGKIRAEGFDENVYSNVPYQKVEYTARTIVAYFNLDLALIRGYGLPEPAADLLVALSLLKVRRFLDTGLRLRTACDLIPSAPLRVKAPAEFEVPAENQLLAAVKQAISDCRDRKLFASPPITAVEARAVKGKSAVPQQDATDSSGDNEADADVEDTESD